MNLHKLERRPGQPTGAVSLPGGEGDVQFIQPVLKDRQLFVKFQELKERQRREQSHLGFLHGHGGQRAAGMFVTSEHSPCSSLQSDACPTQSCRSHCQRDPGETLGLLSSCLCCPQCSGCPALLVQDPCRPPWQALPPWAGAWAVLSRVGHTFPQKGHGSHCAQGLK